MAELTEPMTDAEAEAALLALGKEPLVWEEPQTFHGYTKIYGRSSTVTYSLTKKPGSNRRWALRRETFLLFCSTHYGLVENAKAACERHHATGSWN